MGLTRSRSLMLGAAILTVGVGGLLLLVALRPDPPREERERVSPLVTTVVAESGNGAIYVTGSGTVVPTQEVTLVAETPGKIVSTALSFVTGGVFGRGDVLVRIDPADYENAVAVAEAEVTQRRFELLRAREEADVAREEWERLRSRAAADTPADSELGSLVLKEPQLKLAESMLKGAEARLADAQNRLGRTLVVAPFNGRVRRETVDVGQFVGAGQSLGVIYNTDVVEISVPLSTRDAALVDGLWYTSRSRPMPARVHSQFGDERRTWPAYVHRADGAIDADTRTINVVVRVADPYRRRDDGAPPLLVGTFAEVEIEARPAAGYVTVPRAALREGDEVWLVEDSKLRVRPVQVVQEVDNQVILRDGISAGDRIVISPLAVMTDGMSVRVAE